MLKEIKSSSKMLGMPVKLYAVVAIVVVAISALAIVGNLETVSAADTAQSPGDTGPEIPRAGAISPMAIPGLERIYSYEIMYSANKFAPRIWLRNSTAYIGQLIFMPDGSVLPNDNLVNRQVNLYYHLQDFENTLDILRYESPVYLLYSGSGSGFENGLRTYPESVGEGEQRSYITTTYK